MGMVLRNKRIQGLSSLASFVAMMLACTSTFAQRNRTRAIPSISNQSIAQQNGTLVTVPQKGFVSRRNGLTVSVDTHWAEGYGYRPIEVAVQSPKPTTADHLITVRLHAGSLGDMCAEQDF